jgi:parvulin-like peptidyl-prolyl isomerase
MKKILVAVLMLAIAGYANIASTKTPPRQASVATVDGRAITVAKLDSTIRQLEKNSNTNIANDDPVYVDSLKRIALDSLINHRLIEIREDSIKMALNNDWEFNQNRLEEVNQAIMKVLFDKQIVPRVKFDSSEVVKYYDENPDQFMESEKVSARHILIRRPKPDTVGVTSEKKRKKILDESEKFAKDRADAVLKKALAGENWDTLAATYSEDANNAKKGGDLGYFIRGRMQPEFDSAAFAATPGSIIGPISTRFGYHIIKVEDHKQPAPKEFNADLWEQIHAQLIDNEQKKIANQYLDSLKTNSVIVYNDSMLAKPDSLVNDRTWIMTVNGNDTLFERTVKQNIQKYQRWKQLDSITVADKKDMLTMMAGTYMLRSAAKNLNYMNDPVITNTSDEYTTSEARSRLMNYMQNTEYQPSDKEIEDYYNANIDTYKEKRPLLVYHILFQDSLKAEAVRDSIVAGADFGDMAKRYYPGDPEIREVLYNLDYIGPQEMGLEFFQAADSMKVGEVSHPVKSQWGYHIIKLVNRKEDRTLAQVIPGIKQHLKDVRDAEKTGALVTAWRQGATIKIDEKAFKKFKPEEKKVIRIESKGQAGS